MDIDLKNRLWNNILEDFIGKLKGPALLHQESERGRALALIWKEFFNKPLDEVPKTKYGIIDCKEFQRFLKIWYLSAQWFEIYDLIEFLASLDSKISNNFFTRNCNIVLEKEVSGYRIINEKVVQVTSEEEIDEIEEAIESTNIWDSVNIHLRTALDLLSDRKSPEYRNSIKESISAVESLCSIITNDKKATLGKALSEIERKYFIHAALKNSFSSLYGYTSDSSGIRHALTEGEAIVGFEDAKLMLVSCSAFINYLKAKSTN